MPRSVIGIDIRKTSLSAVHLMSGFKETTIKNFARIKIVADDRKTDPLSEGLKALAEKLDFSNAATVVSIPAHQVIFRNLEIPFDDPKKIRQVLPFELEPSLPLAVESTVIDFEKIKIFDSNLLTAAVEKDLLEQHLSALAQAGIRPCMVVPSGYPLALRLGRTALPEGDCLVIDTEDNRLTLFLIADGYIGTVRTPHLALNKPDAAATCGTLIHQALIGFSLRFNRQFNPEKIWLTGSGLANKSNLRQIANKLQHPLAFVNLLQNSPDIKINGATAKWHPVLMDNALSLALLETEGGHSLNFFKRRSTIMAALGQYRKNLLATAVLAALVGCLALGKVGLETAQLKKRARLLDRKIEQTFHEAFPDVKRVVAPLHQMKVGLEKERKSLEGPTGGPPGLKMIDVLAAISKSIDEKMQVRLTRLVAGADSITLAGKTTGFKVVDTIKGRLEKTPGFEKVTITSATTDKSGNQVQFKIRIKPAQSRGESG